MAGRGDARPSSSGRHSVSRAQLVAHFRDDQKLPNDLRLRSALVVTRSVPFPPIGGPSRSMHSVPHPPTAPQPLERDSQLLQDTERRGVSCRNPKDDNLQLRRRPRSCDGIYNSVRLHSAIGFVTPCDKLVGRKNVVWAERDRKLEAARQARATMRLAASHVVNQPA